MQVRQKYERLIGRHWWWCRYFLAKYNLNTPYKGIDANDPAKDVKVVDPKHPLYGHIYSILSISRSGKQNGHVLVKYDQDIALQIPTEATDLNNIHTSTEAPPIKLTYGSLEEFVLFAEELKLLCPLKQRMSGKKCQSDFKKK